MNTKVYDVFISHSSKDSLVASALKQHLQSNGLRCWNAPDDIQPGESWPTAILRAISSGRIMVLIWSGNSIISQEVSKELSLAMRYSIAVVPFRIEAVAAAPEWEYHLANTHWMDAYSGKLEDHFELLLFYLLGLLPDCTRSMEDRSPPKDTQDSNIHVVQSKINNEIELNISPVLLESNASVLVDMKYNDDNFFELNSSIEETPEHCHAICVSGQGIRYVNYKELLNKYKRDDERDILTDNRLKVLIMLLTQRAKWKEDDLLDEAAKYLIANGELAEEHTEILGKIALSSSLHRLAQMKMCKQKKNILGQNIAISRICKTI